MKKKLNIVLASETYPPDRNGAATFVQRLANMLSEDGHNVLVLAPSSSNEDHWETINEHLSIFRVRTISLKPFHPYFRTLLRAGLSKKIGKKITEFKPDLIHIHNHFFLGRGCLKIAKRKHIPIIGTNHFMPDNLLEYFPDFVENIVAHYMWKDFIKVYNKLDFVTTPTKTALNIIKNQGLKSPSKVISNGLDLEKFKKNEIDESTYKKFKINKKKTTFLFVGRLEKDKNIDVILKALDLERKKLDIQMIIVGIGRDEKDLKKQAKTLKLGNKVIFTGEVTEYDLKQLYNIADVYVGSGSAELQGLAVMEAMAYGLPILAVNANALPELVKHEVNGYLFELNPYDLASKMIKILSNKKKQKAMGKMSLEKIQKHDYKKTLKLFLKLYKEIIN